MARMTFKEYLGESYINLFIGDTDKREQYKDEVFKLLQDTYSDIGGLKGNGFANADDMVKKIPFWKLFKRGEKIIAVAMYKDKGGRKRVAVGSDGTADAKAVISNIFRNEFGRAYFEISKKSLSFHARLLGYDFLIKYAKTPEEAKKISGDDIEPVPDNDEQVKKHAPLKKYFYQREVGGKMEPKVMFGTTGQSIVQS